MSIQTSWRIAKKVQPPIASSVQKRTARGLGRPADGRDQIEGAGRQILRRPIAALQLQPLGGMQRGEILEQHLAARTLRRVEIDLAYFEQREIALAVFRRG